MVTVPTSSDTCGKMMDEKKEREARILTAAATLIVRFGYDKTTVSEIAREAGVSKGAIYLHFESKEDLFEALLEREVTAHSKRWFELTERDPGGGSIAAMYRNTLLALDESPFMSAMFRRDSSVLGSYLKKPDNFFTREGDTNVRYEFVKKMQEVGAVRDDVDPRIIAHIMNMLAYGLVAIGDVMPAEQIPPTDEVIEGIAVFMDAALTPPGGADMEGGKRVVRQIMDAYRAKLASVDLAQSAEQKEDES